MARYQRLCVSITAPLSLSYQVAVKQVAQASRLCRRKLKPVGRESEAHPAISIIPSLDFERYHLPPIQGYKCRVPRIDESLNTANPRPS